MATNIFSEIEGLTVDKDDILEAELFAEQYLSAAFPTYDFRQGTALRDMTVRPNATLLALINKAIKYYFDDTDVLNMTNSTDNDIVDSRLSNFFITRKSGDNSVVRARLYFSFPTVNPIATIIPSSASFSVDNETLFFTSGSISVNRDPGVDLRIAGQYYFLYDSSEELHYVDVDLTAETASSDGDLEEGDLLYFTLFSPYFLSGTIQYLVSSAVNTETNEEMVERAYTSISTRNLINTPSIISSITDQFNYAKNIYPVGLGNDYLYRDLVTIEHPIAGGGTEIVTHHKGGHVDIYIDTNTTVSNLQFSLDENSTFRIAGPVISISRSIDARSGKDDDTVPISSTFKYRSLDTSEYIDGIPVTPRLDNGLSTSQVIEVEVPTGLPGETLTLDILTFSGLNSIQTAINSDDQRVVCADYLVRAFEPVYLSIDVEVRSLTNVHQATEALKSYISSLDNGVTLYVSDLISVIQNAGVTSFNMPIGVTGKIMSRYRQGDTSDTSVIDYEIVDIVNYMSLRENQMFQVGDINLEEV